MAFELTREFVGNLRELIAQKDERSVANLVSGLHPADIADIFDELGIEEAKFLYLDLDGETRADILIEMDDRRPSEWGCQLEQREEEGKDT